MGENMGFSFLCAKKVEALRAIGRLPIDSQCEAFVHATNDLCEGFLVTMALANALFAAEDVLEDTHRDAVCVAFEKITDVMGPLFESWDKTKGYPRSK